MNIKELLECYGQHRHKVLTGRAGYRPGKAEACGHILTGFQVALDNRDEFLQIIHAANNRENVKVALISNSALHGQQTPALHRTG
jgi:DNA gyrase subunit A